MEGNWKQLCSFKTKPPGSLSTRPNVSKRIVVVVQEGGMQQVRSFYISVPVGKLSTHPKTSALVSRTKTVYRLGSEWPFCKMLYCRGL